MNQPNPDDIRRAVMDRYGRFARESLGTAEQKPAASSCCGGDAHAAHGHTHESSCCGGDTHAAHSHAAHGHTAESTCCGGDAHAHAAEHSSAPDEAPIPHSSRAGLDACCGPAGSSASTCGSASSQKDTALSSWAEGIYDTTDVQGVDRAIAELTLGCGNPVAIAEMKPGETVLDLGSGAGLDCFLSARQVGPSGRVIGVDMTPDMLELSRRNLAKVGAKNVEFREGFLEELPVETGSVDVVISNCVINLSADKPAVLHEAFRVLRPGGRFRVSDIVWLREPTDAERSDMASWAGCIAGALHRDQFAQLLAAAGFTGITIEEQGSATGSTAWTSALITAVKPRGERA